MANEAFEKAVAMYRHAMRLDGRHYNAWYGGGDLLPPGEVRPGGVSFSEGIVDESRKFRARIVIWE